jgi:hypothetical protein
MQSVARQILAAISLTAVMLHLGGCPFIVRCVAEHSAIATPNGDRPIESLRVGDEVWTLSEAGDREVGRVQRITSHLDRRTLELTTRDGHTVVVSPTQPLLVEEQWIPAAMIGTSDSIAADDGPTAVVSVMENAEPVRVFDLTVEPNGNFFANGILAHNKSFAPQPKPQDLSGPWIGHNARHGWFYVELNADGTGRAAQRYRVDHDAVHSLAFDRWSVKKYDVTIDILSAAWGPATYHLEGTATRDQLTMMLLFNGSKAGEIIFNRPQFITQVISDFQDAANELPNAAPPAGTSGLSDQPAL